VTDRELVALSRWTGEPDRDHVYHHSDLSDAERLTQFGTAAVDMPASFEAGSTIDVRFRFVIGDTQLPVGAGLRIAWRWPFDWAALQTDDDGQPNYLALKTPPTCEIESTFERAGGLNPWQHHIDLRVTSGALRSGDIVEISLTAWEGPTFSTADGYFLMLICPAADKQWMRLVDPPRFCIHAGPASRLIAIAPADGNVGEKATVRIRAVDEWGNATPVEAPSVAGAAQIGTPVKNDGYAVWEVPVSWTQSGVHRLEVQAGDLGTNTNPSRIHEHPQKQRLLWGDLHGGQSEIGCGAGSLDHHYAYARDVAGLQFTSQQANDHYITAALWQHVRDVTPRYNSPDFLAFLGCEWSPYTQDGGDRNVIYLTDEAALHRSDRFFEETDPDSTADLRQAPEFLQSFRTRAVRALVVRGDV